MSVVEHTIEGEVIETNLVPANSTHLVRPAITPDEALAAFKEYQDLCEKVLTPEDVREFEDRKGNIKKAKLKSGWRKLAMFFNLSVELVSEKEIKEDDGSVSFDVMYKATHPNGRTVSGDGSCNSEEKKGPRNSRHNTRSTAQTRAFNRAVSNLIGFGEVSWEEMNLDQPKKEAEPLEPAELESYVIPFGKFKGESLGAVDQKQLQDYCNYLFKQAKGKGEPISEHLQTLIDLVKALRLKREISDAGDQG